MKVMLQYVTVEAGLSRKS